MAPSGNGNMLQIYQGERFDCDADDGCIVDRGFGIVGNHNDDPVANVVDALHQHAQEMTDESIGSPFNAFHQWPRVFLHSFGKGRKCTAYILDSFFHDGLNALERFYNCRSDLAAVEC